MSKLLANSSVDVVLPAGQRLSLSGVGNYQVVSPARPGVVGGLRSISVFGSMVGPFATNATVSVLAQSAVSYSFLTDDDVVDRDGDVTLTAAQTSAVQSLVSKDGLTRTTRYLSIKQARLGTIALAANPLTTYVQLALAARPYRMRIGLPNRTTADLVGVRACVAPTATLGLPGGNEVHTPSTGYASLVDCTFAGGATSGTMPAAASTAVDTIPGMLWTDWFATTPLARDDGLSGFLYCIRVEIPGSTVYGGFSNTGSLSVVGNAPGMQKWEDTQYVGWRTFRQARRSAGTGGVTNKALENGVNGNGVWSSLVQAVWVEYESFELGRQLVAFGDSLTVRDASTSDHVGYSWVPMLADLEHTAASPVECANLAIGTTDSVDFTTALTYWTTTHGLRPTHVVWSAFTPNNPLTAANVLVAKTETSAALAAIRAINAKPILWTGAPSTPTAAGEGSTLGKNWAVPAGGDGNDALRVAYNAEIVRYQNALDFSALLSGEAYSTGQIKLKQAYSFDGLHLSDAAHVAMAALADSRGALD